MDTASDEIRKVFVNAFMGIQAEIASSIKVYTGASITVNTGDFMGLYDCDAQAIGTGLDVPSGGQSRGAARHLMCRRYAQHSHQSLGRVKQTVVQYFLQRFNRNHTLWSDAHEPSSTRHIERRRESVPGGCQGRKRGRHRAGVSVPTSSERDPPGCQLGLQTDVGWSLQAFLTTPTLHLFDVLMIWIDQAMASKILV